MSEIRRPASAATRRSRIVGASIVAASPLALIGIGLALGPGPTGFDRAILTGMRACDPSGRLLGIATDVTALGSGPVLTLVVIVVAGWLLVRGRVRTALLIAAASEGVGLVVDLAKAIVARPRPELVPHWIAVGNFSFPSAHSADSAAIATLLVLSVAHARPGRAARRYATGTAMLLVGAIGCSRVYLAVHWPSDVLAGWGFGAVWAFGWWRAVRPSGAGE